MKGTYIYGLKEKQSTDDLFLIIVNESLLKWLGYLSSSKKIDEKLIQ